MARTKLDGGTTSCGIFKCSVNSSVSLNNLDGIEFQLKYPTIDN